MPLQFFDRRESQPDPMDTILGDLIVDRKNVGAFVQSLILQRRLRFDLHPNTSLAYTDITPKYGKNTYEINLGSLLTHPEIFQRLTFQPERFQPKERIQYKLLHEISHCFVNELVTMKNTPIQTIMRTCEGQHAVDHLFFTPLASYKADGLSRREIQELAAHDRLVNVFEEDATELVCMALWSRKYFVDYLKFLSDPSKKEERVELGLRRLSSDQALEVGKTVLSAVQANPGIRRQ